MYLKSQIIINFLIIMFILIVRTMNIFGFIERWNFLWFWLSLWGLFAQYKTFSPYSWLKTCNIYQFWSFSKLCFDGKSRELAKKTYCKFFYIFKKQSLIGKPNVTEKYSKSRYTSRLWEIARELFFKEWLNLVICHATLHFWDFWHFLWTRQPGTGFWRLTWGPLEDSENYPFY